MSTTLTDRDLLAWLAGALEPGRALDVQEEVSAFPEVRARVALLTQRLQEDQIRPVWRIPPPGVAGGRRGFTLERAALAVMGEEVIRPGDRFTVRIGAVPDAEDRRLVVLYRRGADWDVVFPSREDEDVQLDVIPAEPSGERVLELVAQEDLGEQRWAVALPLADPVDWSLAPEARWQSLVERIATGEVPVTSVRIQVQ